MPFDGGFTHQIAAELQAAVDCHIDKLYQPSHDELVFLLRKKGFSARLLISARPGAARVHFTEEKTENPETPPMFCMLARKHFSGARLVRIEQPGLERVLSLVFETSNEMGDRVSPRVICELIGNQANIVMVGQDGRIIDAVRRSDVESGQRLLQPGAVYRYPPAQGKQNPLAVGQEELLARILETSGQPLSRAILSLVDGFSPLIAREIAYAAFGDDPIVGELDDAAPLAASLRRVLRDLSDGGRPLLILRDGAPADFSYTPITQYGSDTETVCCESYSRLLDAYYSGRESRARMHRAASDIQKTVSHAHTRAVKRLALRREELKACAGREQLRIYGELLKANLYAVENGARFAEVQNYYDPELSTIRIPLNPALSPAANAAKYFKDYKKSYTAEQTLTALTQADEQEIEYLESVLESLERCDCLADLAEIREELCEGGYLRRRDRGARRKKEGSALREYRSPEGYRVLVGRNNSQNDYITTRVAAKSDLWFHVKNIPGSHVIVCSGGGEVSEETLLGAAQLAAFCSKASASRQVPVDYTPVKYVKKPNGAKPGMVIYTTNRTLYVNPRNDAFVSVGKER